MKKILPLLLLFSQNLYAVGGCKLASFDKIIKINKVQDQAIIKASDCPTQITEAFSSFIASSEGLIDTQQLSLYFTKKFKKKIILSPKEIEIINIKELVQAKVKNPLIQIKELTSLYSQSSINLDKDEHINIDCSKCEKAGEQNLSINLKNQKIWLTAKVNIKRQGFFLKKPINNLKQKLNASFFQEKTVNDNGRNLLFADITNIEFYKFTRQPKQGEVIKKYDLAPRALVEYGSKVQVLYDQNNIKVKTLAVAKQRGMIGDLINITNIRTKKMMQAKVIDFNKVRIEL